MKIPRLYNIAMQCCKMKAVVELCKYKVLRRETCHSFKALQNHELQLASSSCSNKQPTQRPAQMVVKICRVATFVKCENHRQLMHNYSNKHGK